MKRDKNSNTILRGKAASGGCTSGAVRIVYSNKDEKNFNNGNILVTKMTDPSMIKIMFKAAAIVTDVGGVTSHAAIIARELGIPSVVATAKASPILKNGMKIEVDGDQGIVLNVKT